MTSLTDRPETEELLLHLKGLVYVRAILEHRGARQTELARHDAEIARVRDRLAGAAARPNGW